VNGVNEKLNPQFPQTRWTLVLKSRGTSEQARVALSELCEIYYQPVYSFLCNELKDCEKAREFAHEFFERLLERGGIDNADPSRGKFRSYLLGALKHFLIERKRYESRQKRGGGNPMESIDAGIETEDSDFLPFQIADTREDVSDLIFDYKWALTILERALESVQQKYENEGRSKYFETLKPFLVGYSDENAQPLSQLSAAEKLGISESAVRVAIHRLRKHFREAVKTEIAHTIPEGADPDEELHYLIEVISKNLSQRQS